VTEFVTQSAQIGSIPSVPNALATAELDTALLVDPIKIKAYKDSVASQMNDQSAGPRCEDLSDRIGDMTIQTSAQGASILTIPIIDPLWVLPMSGFIQADALGFLWPPIDINFPTGTDCVWRLCQYRALWDPEMGAEANITLTFEDRIASLLREMSPATPGGLTQGSPNQTLGGFFKMLVDNANQVLHLKGGARIRLVEMISPQDPNYTPPIDNLPSSAQSPLRKNPIKQKSGLTADQQKQLQALQDAVSQLFGQESFHIGNTEPYAKQLANTSSAQAGNAGYIPNASYIPGLGTNP